MKLCAREVGEVRADVADRGHVELAGGTQRLRLSVLVDRVRELELELAGGGDLEQQQLLLVELAEPGVLDGAAGELEEVGRVALVRRARVGVDRPPERGADVALERLDAGGARLGAQLEPALDRALVMRRKLDVGVVLGAGEVRERVRLSQPTFFLTSEMNGRRPLRWGRSSPRDGPGEAGAAAGPDPGLHVARLDADVDAPVEPCLGVALDRHLDRAVGAVLLDPLDAGAEVERRDPHRPGDAALRGVAHALRGQRLAVGPGAVALARRRRAMRQIASWMPPRICPPAPLVTSTMTIAQTSSRAPRYSADVWPREQRARVRVRTAAQDARATAPRRPESRVLSWARDRPGTQTETQADGRRGARRRPPRAPRRCARRSASPADAGPARSARTPAARAPSRARGSAGPSCRPRRCRRERCPSRSSGAAAGAPASTASRVV